MFVCLSYCLLTYDHTVHKRLVAIREKTPSMSLDELMKITPVRNQSAVAKIEEPESEASSGNFDH